MVRGMRRHWLLAIVLVGLGLVFLQRESLSGFISGSPVQVNRVCVQSSVDNDAADKDKGSKGKIRWVWPGDQCKKNEFEVQLPAKEWVAGMAAEIAELLARVIGVDAQVTTLQQGVAALQLAVASLPTPPPDLTAQVTALQQGVAALQLALASLPAPPPNLTAQVTALQQQVAALALALASLPAPSPDLTASLTALQQQVAALALALASLPTPPPDLTAGLTALQQQVAALALALASLPAPPPDLTAQLTALQQQVAALALALASLPAPPPDLTAGLTALQQQVAALALALASLPAPSPDLTAAIIALQQRVAALELALPPTPTPTPPPNTTQEVLALIGPAEGVVLPLVEPSGGATFTTVGALAATFTWSKPLSTFDTPQGLQGSMPVVTFNGVNEWAQAPDDDYWSAGDALQDQPFSVGMWVWIDPAHSDTARFISKAHFSSALEWTWYLTDNGVMGVNFFDNSPSVWIGRTYTTPLPKGQWLNLVFTYDGSGQASGIKIYLNGMRVDNANDAGGPYVAMHNLAAAPTLGGVSNPGQFFRGKMAGGGCGPFFTHKGLLAGDVLTLFNLCKTALGLP